MTAATSPRPAFVRRPRVFALLVTVAAFLLATPAMAADPVAFATTSGTCTAGTNTQFNGPTQSAAHSDVLIRITMTGTATGEAWAAFSDYSTFGPNDVMWLHIGQVGAGTAPHAELSCEGATDGYTAEFFDVPDTPSTFGGASSNRADPDVVFNAPAKGIYVADLTLAQGSVELTRDDGKSQTFASSGTFDLGTVTAGAHGVRIGALDGPQARWSLRIRAVPVVVSAVGITPAAAPSGAIQTVAYTVSGDTTITATVTGPAGNVVRTLASGLAASAGEHTFTWDGRDQGGAALPDGSYIATVSSSDAGGNPSSGSATVLLDSTPPIVTFTSSASITPAQAVTVALQDATSNIGSGEVTLDGYWVADLTAGQTSFSYAPRNNWTLGSHEIAISVKDGAGNTARLTQGFRVVSHLPAADSGPTLSKSACARAARKLLARVPVYRRAHRGERRYMSAISRLCFDFTRDGRPDVAFAINSGGSGGAFYWAAFRATAHGYMRVAYQGMWGGRSSWGGDLVIRRDRRDIVATVPIWRSRDAHCCPSGGTRVRRWRWSRGRLRIVSSYTRR